MEPFPFVWMSLSIQARQQKLDEETSLDEEGLIRKETMPDVYSGVV
jgi:hypothetical protein